MKTNIWVNLIITFGALIFVVVVIFILVKNKKVTRSVHKVVSNEYENLSMEHTYLLPEYQTFKDEILSTTDNNRLAFLACKKCDVGIYTLRSGKFGAFAGCLYYPDCNSTLSLVDFILEFIKKYGIDIYCWEKVCYKCKKKTYVYSYYLTYELGNLDSRFDIVGENVGLGDLSYADSILSNEIDTIQICYSNTTRTSYMANICQHCGALQGKNYVVDDPHEILNALRHERSMDQYYFGKIEFKDVSPLKKDIERIYIPYKYIL